MSSEETNIPTVEPEIVDSDKSVVRYQGATIEELAQSENGKIVLERAIDIMKTLRAASIALTYPHDWVLFKADDRITGYLQDVGCQRIRDMWGIEIFNISDWTRVEGEDKEFSYTLTGDGMCKRTGGVVEKISGSRYSFEDFIVKRRLNKLQIEAEVKKAARANLDGSIVRELAALKSVPAEELDQVWAAAGMGGYKTTKLCPKGRGFGSQAERSGANVQQAADVPADQQPFCQQCDPPYKMKFVPGGISKANDRPYDAFWTCTRNKDHKTVKHADVLKSIEDRRKASEGSGGDYSA